MFSDAFKAELLHAVFEVQCKNSYIWANDHPIIASTCLQWPQFLGLILDLYYMNLWRTTTILKSREWSLFWLYFENVTCSKRMHKQRVAMSLICINNIFYWIRHRREIYGFEILNLIAAVVIWPLGLAVLMVR